MRVIQLADSFAVLLGAVRTNLAEVNLRSAGATKPAHVPGETLPAMTAKIEAIHFDFSSNDAEDGHIGEPAEVGGPGMSALDDAAARGRVVDPTDPA